MAVSMTMGRDTKWLTLEVCREFQRGTCSRSDAECKFAHPSRSCHVENGRVIACFDSLKVTTRRRRPLVSRGAHVGPLFSSDDHLGDGKMICLAEDVFLLKAHTVGVWTAGHQLPFFLFTTSDF